MIASNFSTCYSIDSEDSNLDKCIVSFPTAPSIGKFLEKYSIPKHSSKLHSKTKCSGHVLTSINNQKQIEEKEKQKQYEHMKKNERKRIREEKAATKKKGIKKT